MRLLLVELCAAALLCGCAAVSGNAASSEAPEAYELYFQVRDLSAAGGADAVASEPCALRKDDPRGAGDVAEELVDLLLAGPSAEELASPFPAGTALREVRLEDGGAVVDLSSAYGTLSGVGLSLADCCITLTLSQLPGVESVSITVGGRELAYRGVQSLRERDILFSTTEDVVGTIDVTLYFLDQNGSLAGEPRTLDLYEGDTQAETLLRALEKGPEGKDLSPSLPEGFAVQAVWMEDDVCCVNLAASMLERLPENTGLGPALRAVSRSLLTLEPVAAVRFLLDGQTVDRIGTVRVDRLIEG